MVRLNDYLDMTIAVDWDVKPQNQTIDIKIPVTKQQLVYICMTAISSNLI